jgi:hypothetical protein
MKKLLIFLLIPIGIYAQTDSIKVSYGVETVDKFEGIKIREDEDTRFIKSALRVRLNVINSPYLSADIGIEYEQKLGKAFSTVLSNSRLIQAGTRQYAIEPRWYFSMQNRINEGLQKANITGNYLSVQYKYGRLRDNIGIVSNLLFAEKSSFSINLGKQFTNILDMKLSVGFKTMREAYYSGKQWQNDANSQMGSTFFIAYSNKIGLGFLFPKLSNQRDKIRFSSPQKDINHLLKLSLNNLYIDKYAQQIKMDVSYEHRLGKSHFTSNTIVGGYLNNYLGVKQIGNRDSTYISRDNKSYTIRFPVWDNKKSNLLDYQFQLTQQLRYYPFKAKEIKKGKSGNNFNGIYTALQGSYTKNNIDSQWYLGKQDRKFRLGLGGGIQHQFKSNLFFDYGFFAGLNNPNPTFDAYFKVGFVK